MSVSARLVPNSPRLGSLRLATVVLHALRRGEVMKESYVNPFLTRAMSSWRRSLGSPLEFVGAMNFKSPVVESDFSCLVRIAGDVKGICVFTFSKRAAATLQKRYDQSTPRERQEVTAIVAFCDAVRRRAVEDLAREGFDCVAAPPVRLPASTFVGAFGQAHVKARLRGPAGELVVSVSLEEAQAMATTVPGLESTFQRKPALDRGAAIVSWAASLLRVPRSVPLLGRLAPEPAIRERAKADSTQVGKPVA